MTPEVDQASRVGRWTRRGAVAAALEGIALLGPGGLGVAAAIAVPTALAPHGSMATAFTWALGLGAGVVVAVGADRVLRRVLPLVVLLRLSLEFPDRAPSRFKVALRAGTLRHLDQQLQHVAADGVDGDPTEAAARMLELLAALTRYDRRTRGHSERVRAFTELIATEMRLTPIERDRLRWSALLHDIGKLHVDVAVLNKRGALNGREWEEIRAHPHTGARIAAPLLPWLGEWGHAIAHHHERWDGSGYPHQVSGEDIPLGARIVAVADAFEVMTAARSYKAPMGVADARKELLTCAGAQFDPAVVRALFSVSITRLRWIIGPAAFFAVLPGAKRAWALRGRLAETPLLRVGVAALFAAVAIPATEGSTGADAIANGQDADSAQSAAAAAAPGWAVVESLAFDRIAMTSSDAEFERAIAATTASAAATADAPSEAAAATDITTDGPPSAETADGAGTATPAKPAKAAKAPAPPGAGHELADHVAPGATISEVAQSGGGPGHGGVVAAVARSVPKPSDA